MGKSNRFSPEVRERAARMVQTHRGEYPSLWAATESIAPKIGGVPQTLHEWVRKPEIDTGTVPACTQPDDVLRLKKKGLSAFGGDHHGDLYLRIGTQVPEHLSREERESYERLRALGGRTG